jgi:predicted nucleic acid-binding protein
MNVLVDTSVWSLLLRRKSRKLTQADKVLQYHLTELISRGRVVMVGPVRQELLSGITAPSAFESLREHLRYFPDEPLQSEDYEMAADLANKCLAAGFAGTAIDLLLCAAATRRNLAIFTMDLDFQRYAKVSSVRLYNLSGAT